MLPRHKATHFMTTADHAQSGRVIPFRLRAEATRRVRLPIRQSGLDYSPVADLAKFECPESDAEYWHRMVVNAVAFVFTNLLVLAGLWLANGMMVHG
jgi:hypothetical protein